MDFIDRFRKLESRVRQLEIRPSAYVENVIVGGEFDTGTIIPSFFVPFGGSVQAVYGRTLAGISTVEVRHGGALVATLDLVSSAVIEEIDPPVRLEEGDELQVGIFSSASASGLSLGVVIGT